MKGERIRILYLDDEVNNLNAFKASFRRNYEVYTATNSLDARKLLKDIDVHIIIADQRMPGTTGVAFFNSIKDNYPAPIRILLTGYADVEALIDGINKGQIYRYIKKPWDEFELQNAISNAYDIYMARKQLHEKMEELEKTNDELSRFIYSTSHDLRSPLMSVLGIITLSKMDNSVTDPNNYMGMIETSIRRLDGFIQKIIEYYKNSRLEPEFEKINFKSLFNECIEACRLQNINVVFEVEVDQKSEFVSDTFRLSVILNNLISNAIKYQKPDAENPTVKLSAVAEPHHALITVEDNGIGIVPDHLKNIFKMFFRTKNNGKPGTGIGLYIVKEALTRIEGSISVNSVYGEGTKFEIIIPNRHDYPA